MLVWFITETIDISNEGMMIILTLYLLAVFYDKCLGEGVIINVNG